MNSALKFLTVIALLAALVLVAAPAQAAPNVSCSFGVSQGTAPNGTLVGSVGSVFHITCGPYDANTIVNIYAVEPDGRASGLNIYGFFPTGVKTDSAGMASFSFNTEIPGVFSVPPGDYTFVVQELAPGNKTKFLGQIVITVASSDRPLLGASLANALVSADVVTKDVTYSFSGSGWLAGEAVNIWVTQPPGSQCSGLGIDQLTLGALGAGSSSLWSGPGTVKADATGKIAFTIAFHASACRGEYTISARALGSGIGAQSTLLLEGFSTRLANASVSVSPAEVPAFHSLHTVSGSGFPADTIVNCWYTRPDGRVLGFISVNAKTDGSGVFSVNSTLDDFPPFTSTEPGVWSVTCATPDRSALGQTEFLVVGLTTDP